MGQIKLARGQFFRQLNSFTSHRRKMTGKVFFEFLFLDVSAIDLYNIVSYHYCYLSIFIIIVYYCYYDNIKLLWFSMCLGSSPPLREFRSVWPGAGALSTQLGACRAPLSWVTGSYHI